MIDDHHTDWSKYFRGKKLFGGDVDLIKNEKFPLIPDNFVPGGVTERIVSVNVIRT